MTRPPCDVPGCGRPHYGHGFCRAHHGRWRRHGDPRAEWPIAVPNTADAGLSVQSAHRRVRAARGAAAGHRCSGCGGEAAVWCYDGADPAERTDPHGRRYSLNPNRYRPCCRFCLRQAVADRQAAAPRPRRRSPFDVERAAWLYAAGASSRGLAALMGVSRDAVLRALRAHGVAIRPPVAPPRRSRRRLVTPAPSQSSRPLSDHRENDTRNPVPIFTNYITQPLTQSSTHTITTTRTPTPDQNKGQHTEPDSQSGPTHQRSLGVGRVPCGPAAPGAQDPREAE